MRNTMMMTISTYFHDKRQQAARYSACLLPLILLTACALQPSAPPASAPQPAPTARSEAAGIPDPATAPPPRTEPAVQAPSAAQIATLRKWVDQQTRLYRIAAPLLMRNTELCARNARHLLGLTAKTKYSYSAEMVPAAQSVLGLDERLSVMDVLPQSGAAKSGIRRGDVLVAVEGNPLPQGRNAERDAGRIIGAAMAGRNQLNLTIMRDGERMSMAVPLTRACGFGVELGNTDQVNSYADGHRVMITRGMLDFAQSDHELAYALAKEISHNVLARTARPRMGATIDSLRLPTTDTVIAASVAGIQPYSPVLDATADKLSLYMLARAGYRIDGAPGFWKRLASQYPATAAHSHTRLHPSTAYRLSVMTETVLAIKSKQNNKLPLLP